MRLSAVAVLLLLPLAPAAGAEEDALELYGRLLERYAGDEGVRYDAWWADAADSRALAEVVAAFEATDPRPLDPAARTALYINLYNAEVLRRVLDGRPRESIRELSEKHSGFGVFFDEGIDFDGATLSLNALEKRLRDESGDPRVHFAINCASRSCPALSAEPFRADRLEAQLEECARAFLSRADALSVERGAGRPPLARLSKFFDWYAQDFGGLSGVRRFVREHAPAEQRDALEQGFRIAFLDYDWSLNRAGD